MLTELKDIVFDADVTVERTCYKSLCNALKGLGHVRVLLAYHVTPSEEIARQICLGERGEGQGE